MTDCNHSPLVLRALHIAKATVEATSRNKALGKTSRNDALNLAAEFDRKIREIESERMISPVTE